MAVTTKLVAAKMFSSKTRGEFINRVQSEIFDVAIIGGGINGAGAAREAASRGMKVALIEARDFASGTSSRSSKLIHGGIRYLENLEFGLVFEALQERRHLFEIAPHLVHPLRFILPVYQDSRVGMFKLGLGMMLYEALATFEMPELHERLDKDKMLARVSTLNGEGLQGGYAYSDAYMDDDRLVIETLRSAMRSGAVATSYVSAIGAKFENNQVCAIVARDEETGDEFIIKAKHFISTVGPWTDIVASQMLKNWQPILRPSKGVHLTFQKNRLPVHDAVVMVSDDEKRIVFAIPRHEMVIVGTTDTDYSGDPVNVCTTRDDVEYLLHVANRYFRGANLTEADIVASYSGVRPLVYDGAASESKTSREHVIISDPRNITFIAGGKYTTYRKVAESVVETALNNFSLEDQVRFVNHHQTLEPLNPLASTAALARARHKAAAWAKEYGIHESIVHYLVERHGEETKSILELYAFRTSGVHRLWQIEALHAIHELMCFHLRDFFLRRSPLFLTRADHGFLFLDEIAQLFQKELGWSDDKRLKETEAVRQHLEHEMGWRRL